MKKRDETYAKEHGMVPFQFVVDATK